MLSDEEIKAIEIVKEIKDIREMRQDVDGENEDLWALDTTINIIEKQSKEIEYQDLYEKLVDKIKAKIEEYDDKGMTINLTNRSAGKTFQQAVHYEVKKVLQSLLEKE